MKKLYMLIIALSMTAVSFGQLTGTKTITVDYPSVAAAIAALNAQGVGAGGVTFNVPAGYSETFPSATSGLITTTTSSSANPIVFQKSGSGANPVITGAAGATSYDYIICIGGTDYITFDGINVTAPNNTVEWGYALLRASAIDGSQNVVIKNCTITMDKTNTSSYGIYSNYYAYTAPGTYLTITAASGTNSNNKFYNNSFTNVYNGIYLYGYADVSPYAYYDQNNDIGSVTGNTFANFAGGTATAYVIYAGYQNGLKVAKSSINGGTGTAAAIYGIYLGTGTNSSSDIYSNTITLISAGTTQYMYGIYNAGMGITGTNNTLNIYNNTIQNCTYPTATTAYFYGIYNLATAMTINFYGNAVNSNVIGGSGYNYLMYSTTAAGNTLNAYNNIVSNNQRSGGTASTCYMYCMYYVGSGIISIHDNQVFNNSTPAQTYSTYIYGIYASNSATSQTVYNNTIHDQTITSSYTSAHALYGIYSFPGSSATNSVYNNTVYNLTITNTSTGYGYIYGVYAYYAANVYSNSIHDLTINTTSGYGYFYCLYAVYAANVSSNSIYNVSEINTSGYGYGYGIYLSSSATVEVYKNQEYNISMGGAASYWYGIYVGSGTNVYIYNNFISDLKAPASTNATGLNGIYISGGTNIRAYYNTIYLNATSSSTTTFVTNGIYASVTPTVELRNNIIINTSSAPGSTTYFAAAFRRSGTSTSTYSLSSNNNLLYVGTPSANKLLFYDGTNSIQSLNAYKAWMAPRDAQSVTENPPFENVASTPYNLHIKTTVLTQCESGGGIISTPLAITTDIDQQARYPNAGYPNNVSSPATAPDIGADEFGGLLLDLTPPNIAFTPLLMTSSTSSRTLTATITDASGVPVSGVGLPRLYYKKFYGGTWNNVQGASIGGNQYTFTFGGGVSLNDTIYYYIVAQDMFTPTPNVGSNPMSYTSTYTANPPACAPPPATPYKYVIVGTICGTKTVGAGGDYTNLTAAMNAFNNLEMNCAVTFLLLSTYSSAAETFPIVINPNPGSSITNVLTIKPNTGVTATISGASASGQIIRVLNSNTIIDGSNSGGTTRNLTIQNTSTTTPQVMVIGSTGATPITNVTLKNTININGVNSSSAVIVSDGATAGTAGYFNNITIQNNSFQLAYIALYCIANVATGNGSGLVITGNEFNTAGANSIRLVGVYVQGVDGATVTNNIIGNMFNTVDASNMTGIWFATGTVNSTISSNTINALYGSSTGPRGIAVSSGLTNSNIAIDKNSIINLATASSVQPYGIYVFSTTTSVTVSNNLVGSLLNTNTGGYGARGIYIATGLPASYIGIINNVVYDIKGTSDASLTYFLIGIGLEGATGTVNMYHNSVYLSGTYAGYTSATVAAACYIGTGVTSLDARDNILVNTYDNTGSTTDKSYAVYCDFVTTSNTTSDYNDLYVGSGTPWVLGYLAGDRADLAAWKAASGQDANSQNIDPTFVSFADLHPTNLALDNLGVYINSVPTDITGAVRYNPPDMGAYNFGTNSVPSVTTGGSSSITTSTASIAGDAKPNGGTYTLFFDYGTTTSYGSTVAAVPPTATGFPTTNISAVLPGLTYNTLYHYRARGVPSSGPTLTGSDMTFTTPAIPPAVVTTAASVITTATANLNGTVNALTATSTVYFEYGLTTSYTNSVTGIPGTVTGSSVTSVTAPITGLLPYTLYNYRIVATNSGGTTNGNNMTFTTLAPQALVTTNAATNITTNGGRLNGTVNANGYLTTVIFQWGLTPSYGNTATATPASVSGTATTAVYADLSGLQTNTTYYYRCVGTSVGGTVYGAGLSFLTGCPMPVPSGPITGTNSVCANSTGNIYSVGNILNATSYLWTVPPGAVITAGSGTNTITVTFGTSSGNVTVAGNSSCGSGVAASMPVTVNPLPVPTISGPATPCQGSTGNLYTTQAGMTGYIWTVSAGGTLISGQGTNTATVTWNSSGAQSVSVNYTNTSGCSAAVPSSYTVTVTAGPVPTVTGPTSMCVNSGYYNYTTEAGFTNYVWTISSGGIITWGQGTNQAQVQWISAGSQSISVNYNNAAGCPAATPTSLNVTVNPLPGGAGTITGVPSVCGGTNGVAYSVAPVASALTYIWTLPAGATIATGAGTNAITVNFAPNASSGNITVYGNNLCGNGASSPPYAVIVIAQPAAAGAITGQAAVCEGTSGVIYTVPPIANATGYVWTVPPGVSIVAGANTNAITVDFPVGASSGNITVYGSNSCGNGAVSPNFAVTVNPVPPTPVIGALGDTLGSSAPAGNQWYFNGTAIPGATQQVYIATQTGTYWVVVTLNGCSSDTSNNIYLVMTGIGKLSAAGFELYPIPNDGRFTVSVTTPSEQVFSINVFNSIGLKVYELKNVEVKGTIEKVIDLRPAPNGVYTVFFRNDKNYVVKKIIVNK